MATKETVEVEVKSNIGEVSKGASEAAGNISIMGVSLNSVKAGFMSVGRTAKAMFGSIKAGIISTGIGALLIAVVSLVSYFTNTKRGADLLKKAMAGLGAVMSVVTDLFSKGGEIMVNAFKDPEKAVKSLFEAIKKNLMNRLTGFADQWTALGKIIDGVFSLDWDQVNEGAGDYGTAVVQIATGMDEVQQKNFVDSIKEIGKEIVTETKAMIALEGKLQDLRDAENAFMVQKAATRQEIEKARLLAEDESKTAEERLVALKKALELEAATTAQEIAMAKDRVSIQEQQMDLSENMFEDEQKLAQLRAAVIEKETASVRMRKRVITEVNTFEKQIATEKAKAAKLEEQAATFKLERIENETDEELKIRIDAAKELQAAREKSDAKLLELQNFNTLAVIENLKDRALKELEIQKEKELASVESMENSEALKAAIEEKFVNKRAAVEKKFNKDKKKWSEMSSEAQLDIMSSTAGNLTKILGQETEAGKAMAVVQATVDTYKGATSAYASMAGIPVVGPALGVVAAGGAIAAGLANVRAIMSADSSGAISDTTTSAAGGAARPAPEMLSGSFELGGGIKPEPVKAFVVTDEMTNSQDQLANIRRRATV